MTAAADEHPGDGRPAGPPAAPRWRVAFAPAAVREYRALAPDVQRRLRPRLDELARDPHAGGARKLSGADDLYRLRVGDWRIVYQVRASERLALVLRVRHRRDAYRP